MTLKKPVPHIVGACAGAAADHKQITESIKDSNASTAIIEVAKLQNSWTEVTKQEPGSSSTSKPKTSAVL